MTTTLLPIRFRSEQARQFHRTFTNTINVATGQNNSLTPINDQLFTFYAEEDQVIFTGVDEFGLTLEFEPGRIQVFLNGERLEDNEYVTDSGSQIELLTPCEADDIVVVAGYTIYSFPNPSDYYYVFLGRTEPWDDDLSPPTPTDTRIDEASAKNNLIAIKKVGVNDVSLLIPRIDWTANTIYSNYTDDENYSARKFYVMNTSFRIYKCIFSPGSPSTVMPEQTTPGPVYLSDGYCWQLIYEIPAADRSKFMDDNFLPVKFYSTSSTFDHNAIIDGIDVLNGGSGYTTPPTVAILGDGVGAQAIASVTSGAVTSVTVTNPGSGYTFAIIQFIGGGGSGATAVARLQATDLPTTSNQDVASYALSTAGAIDIVEVLDGGELYLPGTTNITVVGDGSGASISPIINTTTGQIIGVQVLDRGRGYTFADLVVTSVTGSGAVLKATISPDFGHGGDVPKELFATTVGLSVNLEDMLSDFFIGNDFRQIGIIKNVKDFYKNEIFSGETGTACYVIEVPSGQENEYNVDDVILTDTQGKYIVTNKSGVNIYLLPMIDSILESSILENSTTGESGLTIESLEIPEFSTKTGDIIYLRNTTPINRQQGQVEQLKLFFGF